MRRGIKNLVGVFPGWDVCGEATNGQNAIRLASELHPDVILLDLSMPGISGIDATDRIRRQDCQVKIILFTLHDSQDLIRKAFQAGANGYLLKSEAEIELARALEMVARNKPYVSPQIDRDCVKDLVGEVAKRRPA
jgi:DNA-binding NarL/FixJ family response regulator